MFRECPTWPVVYFSTLATSTKHSKPLPTWCTSRRSTHSTCLTCRTSTSTTTCTCASPNSTYRDSTRQSRLRKRCQSVFSSLNGSFACSATSCLWSCQRDCGTSGFAMVSGSTWRSASLWAKFAWTRSRMPTWWWSYSSRWLSLWQQITWLKNSSRVN